MKTQLNEGKYKIMKHRHGVEKCGKAAFYAERGEF